MIRRSFSSLSSLQLLLLAFCAVTLAFLWVRHFQHQASSADEALAAKAAEHLNLAAIAGQNLRQLVDRAQVIGEVVRDDFGDTANSRQGLVRMLAEDPVFKRMSLYGLDGRLLSASHMDEPSRLPALWLEQLADHSTQYGFKPLLPLVARAQDAPSLPSWRLPFMLPLVDSASGTLNRILVVQLDIGYLAALFERIDLGRSGMMRLLDGAGQELLRINSSGVVVGGGALEPGFATVQELSGQLLQQAGPSHYQSLYVRLPERGFTVVVSQGVDEILHASRESFRGRLWLNLSMTLLLLGCLLWTLRLLRKRQGAFVALEQAQQANQALIARLEEEHRRSSHAAATDHLSGLHNRRQLLKVAMRALGKGQLMAVLFIDMDRFKSINDSLGHEIGDLLLQAVAGRISWMLGPGDEASRFGGDEFVVLLAGERNERQIDAWVRALVQKLSAPYSLAEHMLSTSPSVGVSLYPRDGQAVDELIRAADAAMYLAKRAGRGQYRFFDASLNVEEGESFALEQAFVEALQGRQFILHYQPQMRLDDMSLSSCEALVRWQHPVLGLLYPDRFIGLAERSGFIVELGWEVLRLACEMMAQWYARGQPIRLAVNVSAIQLRQADFSQRVLDELDRHALKPEWLDLEITETAVLEDENLAVEHLRRLRDAGLNISLDDFGKGYAGFAHLQALPLTKLKLDRALIASLSGVMDDSPIVSSTLILAKRLGLEVVAEGVETREQMLYLKRVGCDFAQGYYFSRPLSLQQLSEYVPLVDQLEQVCVE